MAIPSHHRARHESARGSMPAIVAAVIARRRPDPVVDGPRADLQMRLRQAVARHRPERRELPAPHRLVHVLAHHPRLPVLRRVLAGRTPLAARRPARRGHTAGGELGDSREHRHGDQPLSRGDDRARLLWRQRRQLGVGHSGDGRRIPARLTPAGLDCRGARAHDGARRRLPDPGQPHAQHPDADSPDGLD